MYPPRFAVFGALLGVWLACGGEERFALAERAPVHPNRPRFPSTLRFDDSLESLQSNSGQSGGIQSASLGILFAVRDAEQRLVNVLDEPSRLKPYEETTLDVVVNDVRSLYGISCDIDRNALDLESISTDLEIQLPAHDGTLGGALGRLVAAVDGLALSIAQETLWITTADQAERNLLLVVYNVTDLVGARASRNDPDEFIDVIVTLVESDSWKENGTGEGDVVIYDVGSQRLLLVSNTLSVHIQLRCALDSLRQVAGLPSMSMPRVIRSSDTKKDYDHDRSEASQPVKRVRKYVKVSQ